MSSLFEGKIVLVTGSSRGIGFETACLFAEEGAKLILHGRSEESLRTAEEKLKRFKPTILRADLADRTQIAFLFQAVRKEHGRLDILVNNASLTLSGPFENHSASELKRLMDVNLKAPLYCIREAVPLMKKSRSGLIVNIGSSAAEQPLAFLAAYSSVKAALTALNHSLRQELNDFGIKMCLIEPGAVETEMAKNLAGEFKSKYNQGIAPLSPKTIAKAVLQLCALSREANVKSLIIEHENRPHLNKNG